MRLTWKEALMSKRFCIHFGLSIAGLVVFILTLPVFFNNVLLLKPGTLINDRILNLFTPYDWSWQIFILIYGCMVISVYSNWNKPEVMLVGIESFVIINFCRMTSLYLFTLEAPLDTIPLVDPFLSKVVYKNSTYVKDLFFSGHTSSLFLMFLIEERKWLKMILLLATILLAIFLIWQHVHYSLDVAAAFIVSWGVYYGFKRLNAAIGFKN